MTKKIKLKLAVLSLIGAALITSGFSCKKAQPPLEPITINYWRVWDNASDIGPIIAAYNQLHPNITINYRKLRYEEYEAEMLNAFADNRGPDILSIHNTWVAKYQPRLAPMPSRISMPYQYVQGTLKKELVTEYRDTPIPSAADVKRKFLDVVYEDAVRYGTSADGQGGQFIYGLPLSVDPMVLYYNRELLNNAGIPNPPRTWQEFQTDVIALTKLDTEGNIIQAGAALGAANNVNRSADILSLLMMQNGTKMTSGNSATFDQIPAEQAGRSMAPGVEALLFYTDFASPEKTVYTWNEKMPNSRDAFVRGQVAFYFGYSYDRSYIKTQGPKLDFDIAAMPQIQSNLPINYASYWLESVAKYSKYQSEAWDFILFATAAENVTSYLDVARKPTALRELVAKQQENDEMEVFAAELLTTKSWYRGKNANNAETALKEAITKIITGQGEPTVVLNQAVSQVNLTYN